MKTIRYFFLGAIVLISSATFALGGDIQFPGKSDPTPTPAVSTFTTTLTTDGATQPALTKETQIGWQGNAATILAEILLTIF
jgi:hypothetical protein